MTFACERFHQYIYCQEFEIETDHKPLVSVFKKSLTDSLPRIQQLRLRYFTEIRVQTFLCSGNVDACTRCIVQSTTKGD